MQRKDCVFKINRLTGIQEFEFIIKQTDVKRTELQILVYSDTFCLLHQRNADLLPNPGSSAPVELASRPSHPSLPSPYPSSPPTALVETVAVAVAGLAAAFELAASVQICCDDDVYVYVVLLAP